MLPGYGQTYCLTTSTFWALPLGEHFSSQYTGSPGPDGTWQQGAYDLLAAYRDWMKINAEAIYNSKAIAPFKENNICMTQQDDGSVYFFYLAKAGESQMPDEIVVHAHQPAKGATVTMLGSNKKLKWSKLEDGFKVIIPASLKKTPPCDYAWTLKVSSIN